MSKFIAKFRKERENDNYGHVLMKHQKYEEKKIKNKKWHVEDLAGQDDDLGDIEDEYRDYDRE